MFRFDLLKKFEMKVLIYSCVSSILFFSLTIKAFGQSSVQYLLKYVLTSNESQPYNNQYSLYSFSIVDNKIMLPDNHSYNGYIWLRYMDEKLVEDLVKNIPNGTERGNFKMANKRRKDGVGMYKKFLEDLTVNDWFFKNVLSDFQNKLNKVIDFDSVNQVYIINPTQIFQSYVSDIPNISSLEQKWRNRKNTNYSYYEKIFPITNINIQDISDAIKSDFMIRDFLLEVVDGLPTGNVKVLNINKRELFSFNYKVKQELIQIYHPFLNFKVVELIIKDASSEISLFDSDLKYFNIKLNGDNIEQFTLKDNYSRNILVYESNTSFSSISSFSEGIIETKIIHRSESNVDEYYYFENGILRKIQNYNAGVKCNVWKYYNEIGNIAKLETWNKDLLNGEYKEWDNEGKIVSEGIFRDGLKQGYWKRYNYIEKSSINNYSKYLRGLINQDDYSIHIANETWENGILVNCKGDCNEED